MGIVNVTPDSFSDGGRFLQSEAAVEHALRLIDQGADIIDIGGESTRPGAAPVDIATELERVIPVVEQVRRQSDVAISIDTSKPGAMAQALQHDIDMINDVRALQEPGALDVVAEHACHLCLMHMQGQPRTMQESPAYDDVVADIAGFFRERIDACKLAGIDPGRIVLDYGFGFGKTPEHNLQLLNRTQEFKQVHGLPHPLLVGLSRKSTIGLIVEDRLIGSISGGLAALERGASILRVHDVAETAAAVRVWQSIKKEQLPAG